MRRIKIFGPDGQKLPRINNCIAMPWEDPQASHTQMKKNVTQPPKQILNIYPGDHTPVGTGNMTADACQDLTQPTQYFGQEITEEFGRRPGGFDALIERIKAGNFWKRQLKLCGNPAIEATNVALGGRVTVGRF